MINGEKVLNKGFTLVELSIVIIIIGFLIAAIATGQSLIKQAQFTSIINENTQFVTAFETFKIKYGQFPGDFDSAYAYWGLNCAPDGNPVNCNGNGDGIIAYSGVPETNPNTHEGLHAWQELGLAGMISGNYTGIGIGSDGNGAVGGINSPSSKYPNGIWMVSSTLDTVVAHPGYAQLTNSGHYLLVGAYRDNNMPFFPLFTPSDAQNVDLKIDDGLPNTGSVFGGCGSQVDPCYTQCTDITNNFYQVTTNTPECYIGFFFDKP